jgi:transposase
LDPKVRELDQAVTEQVLQTPAALRLKTHPGVGAVAVGKPERFEHRRKLTSYCGLIRSEDSSGQRRRLGAITKQGNSFVRFLLVEAACTAASRGRGDAQLARSYARLSIRHGQAKAKLAVARRLAIRLWLMWRKQMNYTEFMRPAGMQAGPRNPVV